MTKNGLVSGVSNPWRTLTGLLDRWFPFESPGRKVAQLISIILLVEGVSVLVLFSYVGILLGLVSALLGAVMAILFFKVGEESSARSVEPLGIQFISSITGALGSGYILMVVGAAIVALVVLYNTFVSVRPDYGDADSLCIMFGGMLLIFPLIPRRWYVESTFALVFLGFVVLFLVVPQALTSIGSAGDVNPVGDWYVHYMLAAPFAHALDVMGIPASSSGSLVTIQFQDGSYHTLAISAYCAGLYSFSIFVSAFLSFVLVFERLRNRTLIAILGLGVLVAYLGNLLRMVIVGVVGYYRGLEALHWAHENVGWIIFISWSALFWWVILARLGPRERTRLHESKDVQSEFHEDDTIH